jgi:hypothetical protein
MCLACALWVFKLMKPVKNNALSHRHDVRLDAPLQALPAESVPSSEKTLMKPDGFNLPPSSAAGRDPDFDQPRVFKNNHLNSLPDGALNFVVQHLTLYESQQLAQAFPKLKIEFPQTASEISDQKLKDFFQVAGEFLGDAFSLADSSAQSLKDQKQGLDFFLNPEAITNHFVNTLKNSSTAVFDSRPLADAEAKTPEQAELQAQMMIIFCTAAAHAVKASPHLERVYLDVCTRVSAPTDMEVVHQKPIDVADYIFGGKGDQTGFENLKSVDLGVPKNGRIGHFQLDSHAASLDSCERLTSLKLRMSGAEGLRFLQHPKYKINPMVSLGGVTVSAYKPSPTALRIKRLGLSSDVFTSLLQTKSSGITDWMLSAPPVQTDLNGPCQKRTLPTNHDWTSARLKRFAAQQKADQNRWKQACAGLVQTRKIEIAAGFERLDERALHLATQIVLQAPACEAFIFPNLDSAGSDRGANWVRKTFGQHPTCLSVKIGEKHFVREKADESDFNEKY